MLTQTLRAAAIAIIVLVVMGWRAAAAPGEINALSTPPAQEEGALWDEERIVRFRRGDTVEELTMAEYLLGVLRAEMPASFAPEALKAQAIAARTYVLRERAVHPETDVCDDINCCQAFKSAEEAERDWGSMALYYEQKLLRAVRETDGEVILYDGEPVLAAFFSSAAGHTQGAGEVWQDDLPYLVGVDSPEDGENVPNYSTHVTFSARELRELICAQYAAAVFPAETAGYVTDIVRNDAGYVTSLCIGGIKMRGSEARTLLDLRSPCFTVETADDTLTFHVTGYGHGVGMSQYGANEMAKAGSSCTEIVQHYFSGAVVGKMTK